MVKIEFPENTTKLDYDAFFNLYEKKLLAASPELFNKHKREGCLSVMGMVTCIIFPRDANKYDHRFSEFASCSYSTNSTTIWFPPHLPDMTYNHYAHTIEGCRILTPKGSDTESFFKSYTFPQSVENAYPVVEGNEITPNDCTIVFFNAKVEENKDINRKFEKSKNFKNILSWKKILSATLGCIIALSIIAFLLQMLW